MTVNKDETSKLIDELRDKVMKVIDAKEETIRQQAEEIERQERRYNDYVALVLPELMKRDQLSAEVDVLRQRYTALRECLEWYADASKYDYDTDTQLYSAADADAGKKARTLLAELDRKDIQPQCHVCGEPLLPDRIHIHLPQKDTQGEGGLDELLRLRPYEVD